MGDDTTVRARLDCLEEVITELTGDAPSKNRERLDWCLQKGMFFVLDPTAKSLDFARPKTLSVPIPLPSHKSIPTPGIQWHDSNPTLVASRFSLVEDDVFPSIQFFVPLLLDFSQYEMVRIDGNMRRSCPYCQHPVPWQIVDAKSRPVLVRAGALFPTNDDLLDDNATETNARPCELHHVMARCQTCSEHVLLRYLADSHSHPVASHLVQVMPGVQRQPRVESPEPISGVFKEALRCYSVDAWNGTCVICRTAVELVCKAHGCKGKLQDMIDDMAARVHLGDTILAGR